MSSSCWLPSDLSAESPGCLLSASLLVHPKGAPLQCLREWCRQFQATASRWWGMCFAARSKNLSVLHSLGLCPGKFQVCSHSAQTQQLQWRWKCWDCILNALLSHHLGFVSELWSRSSTAPAAFPVCDQMERFIQPSDSSKPPRPWWDVKHGSYYSEITSLPILKFAQQTGSFQE